MKTDDATKTLSCFGQTRANRSLIRWALALVVGVVATGLPPCTTASLPASERHALDQIYLQTGGEHWRACTEWGTGDPCSGGLVAASFAAANGLTGVGGGGWGPFPAQGPYPAPGCVVCDETNTTVIALFTYETNMTGPIPGSALRLLTGLKILGLSYNRFSGAIPVEICTLSNLELLDFSYNADVDGIPSCIWQMSTLQTIALAHTSVGGAIPLSICNLSNLERLILANASLVGGIPPCIGRLGPTLVELDISSNPLGGTLPESICNLTRATQIDAAACGLEGTLPPCIGQLGASLEIIGLSSNNLHGAIPTSFCNLTSLSQVFLNNNSFDGIPPCIGQIGAAVTVLHLSNNPIRGNFPHSLCALVGLEVLDLNNNEMTAGSIPRCICDMHALEYIELGGTHRTGPIPDCLFGPQLPRLVNFSAVDNSLTGSIPHTLCTATQLLFVLLQRSGLVGAIPECIGNLVSLNTLQLDGLALSGPLPRGLFALPGLEVLLLSGASLTGGLPTEIDFNRTIPFTAYDLITNAYEQAAGPPLGRLRLLGLVACGLSGSLPSWVGSESLRNLSAVALGGNHLTGRIPSFVVGSQLTQFEVPNNMITGELEPLRQATMLQLLDVSANNIGGEVPAWLASRSESMTLLAATDNDLSCTLPSAMSIARGGKVRVLEGNIFANSALPSGLASADPGAHSYSGASQQQTLAGAVLGVVLVASLSLTVGWSIYTGGVNVAAPDTQSPTISLQLLLGAALATVAVVLTAMALPIYVTADSLLLCRYGWASTAAFLMPWSSGVGSWGIGTAVVGGLLLGGVLLPALLTVGHSLQLVSVAARVPIDNQSTASTTAYAVIVTVASVLLLGVLIGINVCFVLLQESQRVAGGTKIVLNVVFALIHDLISNAIGPLAVTSISRTLQTANPEILLPISVAVMLGNSLIAPMVGLLLSSSGCFKNEFFGTRPTVSSSIDLQYCDSGTNQKCSQVGTFAVQTSFTEPFVFDGERCLSSIVVLYTPEFLFIFAVRILLYPVAWWLASIGKPWLLAGSRVQTAKDAFYTARASFLRCGRNHINDADGLNNDARLHKDALQVLHSAEPALQAFGLLSIAVCFGMLSPVLAIAALGVFVDLRVLGRVLGDPIVAVTDPGTGATTGPGVLDTDTDNDVLPDHPLPTMCIALLLAVHSLYTAVVLSVAGFPHGGTWGIIVANWLLFSVAIWQRRRISGRTKDGEPHSTSNAAFGGMALTEPLLLNSDTGVDSTT